MITNWKELATEIGSLKNSSESGGDTFARTALDRIHGQEWVESTVEHIIAFRPGAELAMNCLRLLQSERAASYAYVAYKTSSGERASRAVWLVKHIAHPSALDWVEEFLNDENVMGWGIGVLDQLLWKERIHFNSRVETLLSLAEKRTQLKEQVEFIRAFVRGRNNVGQ